MTGQEIIEMAEQAGMHYRAIEEQFANPNTDGVFLTTLQDFAKLVAAKEREACAKVCDDINAEHEAKDVISSYAEAIRARGDE